MMISEKDKELLIKYQKVKGTIEAIESFFDALSIGELKDPIEDLSLFFDRQIVADFDFDFYLDLKFTTGTFDEKKSQMNAKLLSCSKELKELTKKIQEVETGKRYLKADTVKIKVNLLQADNKKIEIIENEVKKEKTLVLEMNKLDDLSKAENIVFNEFNKIMKSTMKENLKKKLKIFKPVMF